MIKWEYYDLKIDNQARVQFNRYFNDIKLILENQNLSLKEHDVVTDLEDHIIDFIRSKNITTITSREAEKIITELGPAEEYADFSNLPELIEKLNPSKGENSKPITTSSDNQFTEPILCSNCNTKNNQDSIFCIQCGISLKNSLTDNSKIFSNPLSFLFRTKPEYFFSLLSFFLLEILIFRMIFFDNFLLRVTNLNNLNAMIFQTYTDFFNLILLLILLNELIVVPVIFNMRLGKKDYSRADLASFLATYLLKILTLISMLAIFEILGNNTDKWTAILLISCILIIYPILLTKILFFSDALKYFLLKKPLNRFSKLGYRISTVFLVLCATLAYRYNNSLFIITTCIIFVFFMLFVLTDFGYFSKFFNEDLTKTSKRNFFGQITELSNYYPPKNKIVLLSEKFHLLLVAILGASFLLNFLWVYDNGVPFFGWFNLESQLNNIFVLRIDNFFFLFTAMTFIFVLIDIFFDSYYHKSSNIFLLTLGIFFLSTSIFITYLLYFYIFFPGASSVPMPIQKQLANASKVPFILGIFVLVIFFIFVLLSVLAIKSEKLSRINNVSFTNKIFNAFLFCGYIILFLTARWVDYYSFYHASLTFFLGFSFLLLIKPFFNLINYFMLIRFKSNNSQTVGVKI